MTAGKKESCFLASLRYFRPARPFRRAITGLRVRGLQSCSGGAAAPSRGPQAKAASPADLPQLLNGRAGQFRPGGGVGNALTPQLFDDSPDPALQIRGGILNCA